MGLEEKIRRRELPFDDVVEALRQLAVEAERAEEEFIRACMAMEESGLWRDGAPARDVTFSQFLHRVVGIAPSRYERGARALRDPELSSLASRWGMSAVGAIAEVQTPDGRSKAMDSVRATWEKEQRPLPSRTAKSIVAEAVGGKVRVSREDARRAEIVQLERELSSAKRRIAELESENESLRESLGGASEDARKKKAKRVSSEDIEKAREVVDESERMMERGRREGQAPGLEGLPPVRRNA